MASQSSGPPCKEPSHPASSTGDYDCDTDDIDDDEKDGDKDDCDVDDDDDGDIFGDKPFCAGR